MTMGTMDMTPAMNANKSDGLALGRVGARWTVRTMIAASISETHNKPFRNQIMSSALFRRSASAPLALD